MKFPRKIILFLAALILSAVSAGADWINLTGAMSAPNIAEIHVEGDRVRLVLEVCGGDLDQFIDILPDDWFRKAGVEPPPLDGRMRHFSSEKFRIIADGRELPAELKLSEQRLRKERPDPFAGMINPVTRQPIPGPPDDRRVLYAEIDYPLDGKPETLTVVPPLDDRGRSAASIGFITYHGGVPVVDYRWLPGEATLRLDWDDPWYSRFDDRNMKRWQQSGLATFLYIEPHEVRHEVLARVRDLEEWMELGLRGGEYIEADEVEPLKKRVGKFFLEHSKVLVDGRELRPILDRVSFVKYTLTRTYFIEKPERMPLNTAMIGVIITYLTKEIPKQVTVEWDLFSDRIQKIPARAIDPAGPFPSSLTPDDNILTWTNFLKTYRSPTVAKVEVNESLTRLKLPFATILCLLGLVTVFVWGRVRHRKSLPAGVHKLLAVLLLAAGVLLLPVWRVSVARPAALAPALEDGEAVAILDSLLKNIYRSFDFREEEDVYDRLATSVSGDLLSEIYLQNRKSMEIPQAGGARARVKEVEVEDVKVSHLKDSPLGLLFRATWTAMGTVGHWGHIHTRKNRYEADVTVEPSEGSWKITGLELKEEQRIDPYAQQK